MGHRANLVVVRGGKWRLYYDHWAANRLDVELFWGPALATEFVGQHEVCDDSFWLDEVWCEGAAVIDHDRRVLLWYGGEDTRYEAPLRWVFLDLMKRNWSKWDVRWAFEGILEIGEYLGLPASQFLRRDEQTTQHWPFRVFTEYPGDNDILLTVVENGVTTACQIEGDHRSLELGWAPLAEVLCFPRRSSLNWEGYNASGGLHVELDHRQAFHWWRSATPAIEARVNPAWPGWRMTWLRDRYDEHLALAGIDIYLPRTNQLALKREMLEYIRQHSHREWDNPARRLAARTDGAQAVPATDITTGSAGSREVKFEILDRLEREIRPLLE